MNGAAASGNDRLSRVSTVGIFVKFGDLNAELVAGAVDYASSAGVGGVGKKRPKVSPSVGAEADEWRYGRSPLLLICIMMRSSTAVGPVS